MVSRYSRPSLRSLAFAVSLFTSFASCDAALAAAWEQPPRLWWEATIVGNGVPAERTYELPVTDGLTVRLPFPVTIRCDTSVTMIRATVTVDENLLDLVRLEPAADHLDLRLADACRSELAARLDLVLPHLARLRTYGPGPTAVTGLVGATLIHDHYAAAPATLHGALARLELTAYGSGPVQAAALRARTASVAVLGSGSVEIAAGDSLRVQIAGAGDVVLRGEPRALVVDRFGRGSLQRR
jgi:hypothetical protein